MFSETLSLSTTVRSVREVIFDDHIGMLKMSIPSLCYVFVNWMAFVAISNLDVTTYQV